ncbi:hypothetical protein MGG_16249 [Pyricularia oryzae 70-15]|uniref:Uncharacterized protein n=1 Tax=Pyricularia oryzae (strain 70-15 / ATCC MYA-4617 / FGSC 8958) TaxID=242507 RepID=G4MPU0_PYRO7|nr:uncharacterized protein MGG_16249 [Pyricularia oryzae 70-15]EHA57237.1 hypothetical protein MGG_16249 [Pyricularia oryzae 70-15]KAI7922193.1 hypothetical protein M0657_005738 [Pyricularia oryzae]KAI7926041.1 hypothetical protein M9X92_002997 [Pyricularia oryzae]
MASSPTSTSPFYSWWKWEAGACIIERSSQKYYLGGQRHGDVTCWRVDMAWSPRVAVYRPKVRIKAFVEDDRGISLVVASMIGTSSPLRREIA